ncbi:MAG: hypothetical protein H0X02_10335 [Nitrosomonas sp.]|nr:hypothetical protein [Nitrosomonas sp.]
MKQHCEKWGLLMCDNKYQKRKFRFIVSLVDLHFYVSFIMLTGCATFGSTLNTQVVGSGNTLVLTWDKQHPLARQLQSDSNIRIRADYRVDGRLISEALASSRGSVDRRVAFVLPHKLRSLPDGEICLYIQPSNRGISILPIRAASCSHVDTGGFRYPAWETLLLENMRQQVAEYTQSKLKNELQSIQTRVTSNEKILLNKGVKKLEDCAQIAPGSTQLIEKERPFDVVEAAQHDTATRKICIRQMRNQNMKWMLDVSDLIKNHMTEKETFSTYRNKAQIFLRDWNKWFSSVGAEYRPEIGTENDSLPIVSTTWIPIIEAYKKKHALKSDQISLSKSDRIALSGALLDAYEGCIEDTRKQLMTKLIAWQKQLQSKPVRDREYVEYARQECRKEVEENQKLMTRATELKQQIDNPRSEIVKPQVTLSEYSQTLNFQACGTQ